MVRQTSIDTYYRIKEEGLLSRKRQEVYEIIYEKGPINCRQIIMEATKGRVTNTGAISGRLSELEDRKVVYSPFERECPITGNTTAFYQTTDNLPIVPEPRLRGAEKIKRLKAAFKLVVDYAPEETRKKAYQILHNGI